MKNLNNIPQAVRILDIKQENSIVKTYTLEVSLNALPGQFCNIWIPGIDEKPFSVASDDGRVMKFSIAKVGKLTEVLDSKQIGDRVGIRGPYGKPFTYEKNQNLALLGGGYGAAPLFFLAQNAVKDGCKVDFIVGARNKDLLLYIDYIKDLENVTLHIATDDGSVGHHGYNTQLLEKVVSGKKIDMIYTCGPEVMMKRVFEIALQNSIKAQISVERYMKCGFGVCGNCVNDGTGKPSCTNGPVMTIDEVKLLEDFGKYHRDSEGKKKYL